jgi:hypothetical protein
MMKLVLVLPIVLLMAGCGFDAPQCANEIVERTADPAGGRVAYRYLHDCGATTDFTTMVAIGTPGQTLEDAEIVFVANSNNGRALADGRGVWTRVTWTRPGRLLIAYSDRARLFRSVAKARGATINYRATTGLFQKPVA